MRFRKEYKLNTDSGILAEYLWGFYKQTFIEPER